MTKLNHRFQEARGPTFPFQHLTLSLGSLAKLLNKG